MYVSLSSFLECLWNSRSDWVMFVVYTSSPVYGAA